MISTTKNTLQQFKEILLALPYGVYSQPCKALSDATIGQHARHIIELYQCLLSGYEEAVVSYDKRERNRRIETELPHAAECIDRISNDLEKSNKELTIELELNGKAILLSSNFDREVMYNLEHTIHHQALIRVAIESLTEYLLPLSFGLAPSTLQYRKACAQ